MATNNNQTIEDARFEEILALQGIDLQEFYQESPARELFTDAQSYPDFFNQNLVSPNRILKKFTDNPQSNIRIFYYQILRLGYQIQTQSSNNKNFLINLRRIIFHPEFQILFTQQTEEQRDLFNDFQFKKLFAQFIVLLDKQQQPNTQQIICHYPFIDTVFIHILRSLLASQNINEEFDVKIPSEVVFGQLSSLLELNVTSYGNCWKFQDSDMFCYEENENELYLAYIIEDDEADEQFGQQKNSNLQNQHHRANVQQNIIANVQSRYFQKNDSNNRTDLVNSFGGIPNHSSQSINSYHQPSKQSHEPYQHHNQAPYANYSPRSPETNMNSHKPSESMISQKYEFTDYLGVTTTQKHKVPKQKQQNIGLANYDRFLNNIENSIKSSFLYKNDQNSNQLKNGYDSAEYKPSDYFTNNYQVNKSEDIPSYNNQYRSNYKSEQPSYKDNYHQNNGYNSSNYDSYKSPAAESYNKEYTPYQYTTPAFKPVQPTPLHAFDNYTSKYNDYNREYNKPSTSYETSYDYKPSYSQSPYGSTSALHNNDYGYKPSYGSNEIGDYYKDFTSPDILAKLRSSHRQNINKIRQSMKGVFRGAELPPGFDLKKSAIYSNNNNSIPKEELYRNESRSQFQYVETHKSGPSKPFLSNNFSLTSNMGSGQNYNNSYGNYNSSYNFAY